MWMNRSREDERLIIIMTMATGKEILPKLLKTSCLRARTGGDRINPQS
jgi:hypothetical protein